MSQLPNHIQFVVGSQDLSKQDNLELSTSDSVPGGYDTCTFQLCEFNPNSLPLLSDRVWLYDKTLNKTVWLGRLEEPDINTNKEPQRFTARGYGFVGTTDRRLIGTNLDGSYGPLKFRAGQPVEDVIHYAVSQCNDVFDESVVTGGLQLWEETQNYSLGTPFELLNFATALTSQFSTPLIWWVRETSTSPVLAGLTCKFLDDSARYRCSLLHNDKEFVRSRYSVQGIVNRSLIGWGKEQYELEPNPTDPINYTALRILRDKAANASNNIRGRLEARALGASYLARFNIFRAISDTIQICESEVTAQPPLFSIPTTIPHYLIKSGYGIYITNMPLDLEPYTVPNKFIVRSEYNWGSGVCTLQCGEIINLEAAVALFESFNTNRLYQAYAYSPASYSNVNADITPIFGPNYPGFLPVSFSNGVPVFVKDKDGLPLGAVVHPDLVADEGLESNFVTSDLQTSGFKGAVRVIPGKFDEAEILLGDETGLVEDNCEIEIYRIPEDTSIMSLVFGRKLSAARTSDITFPAVTFGRREWVMTKVVTASTIATWASISLHAKKQYPGLKVNG